MATALWELAPEAGGHGMQPSQRETHTDWHRGIVVHPSPARFQERVMVW